MLGALADVLGTTTEDLKAKLDAGSDLASILEEQGVSRHDAAKALDEALKDWQPYSVSGTGSGSNSFELSSFDALA